MESVMPATQSHIDPSPREDPERRNTKRRKLSHETSTPNHGRPQHQSNYHLDNTNCIKRWRTEAERRIYSTKLVEALSRSRQATGAARGRQVRETADRVLAAAAKGTTRWSRAILAGRFMRMRTRRRLRRVRKATGLKRKEEVSTSSSSRKLPDVEKRLRVLSRLVPGCRKVTSFSSLLEEATDYISALEMQVKAMAALTEILAAAGGGGGQ